MNNYTNITSIYRLREGNIGISHAPMLQNFGNFYGLPKDEIEIAPIIFGSDGYLNKTGFVAIVTGDTTTKTILLYFL